MRSYSNADAILESLIVPFDKVKLAEKLDSGQFGAVFAGTLETENGVTSFCFFELLF